MARIPGDDTETIADAINGTTAPHPPTPTIPGKTVMPPNINLAYLPPSLVADMYAGLVTNGPVSQIVSAYKPIAGGYATIPFPLYTLSALVVAAPIFLFSHSGRRDWVWPYITLITLSLFIYYRGAFDRFTKYLTSQKAGK